MLCKQVVLIATVTEDCRLVEGVCCGLHSLNGWWFDSLNQFAILCVSATGSRGNRWSLVTIRLALAVYTRSPAAYSALKNFGLIQLPSQSTLQAYTGAFRDDAGMVQFAC